MEERGVRGERRKNLPKANSSGKKINSSSVSTRGASFAY